MSTSKFDPNATDALEREMLRTFVTWFSASVFLIGMILMISVALNTQAADVFIDEQDGDYQATPVGGPAPASTGEAQPVANDYNSATAAPIESTTPAAPVDNIGQDLPSLEPEKPVAAAPQKEMSKKKSKKGLDKKNAKKSDKKAKAKLAKNDHSKKKKSKGKTAKKADSKKRKIASVGGDSKSGKFAVSAKSCHLATSPGAKTYVGETAAGKKLWVEKSKNAKYYKVHVRDGSAAYVSKSCFN